MKKNIFLIVLLVILFVFSGNVNADRDRDGDRDRHRNKRSTGNYIGKVKSESNSRATVNINKDAIKAYGGSATIKEGAVKNYNTNKQIQVQQQTINVDMTPVGDALKAQVQSAPKALETEEKIQAAHDKALIEAAGQSRDFVRVPEPYNPGSASDYLGPWNSGPQVMKASDIISYQNVWFYNSVRKINTGMFERVRIKFRPIVVGGEPALSSQVTYLTDFTEFKNSTKTLLGFMYAQATGDEADTALVLQKATKVICEMGGNAAVIIGEGYTTDLDAKGGGIGLSYTQVFMSTDGKSSGGGSGGTGFNWHKSGPETKPWVQFAIYEWINK